MTHILWIILIGFAAGLIARFIMPGRDPKGCLITTLLGIGGSVVATFLGQFFGLYHYGERAGFIGAVIGAVIILVIYRSLKENK